MVEPDQVSRILLDAARLIREGDLVVFGSAALAFWLTDPPHTRDVDVWTEPPEAGEAVQALMGELSWYHDRHGAYVEVWGPETFAAPSDWRHRARVRTDADAPGVRLWVPHPHDILVAKLERWEEGDRAHAAAILREIPMGPTQLEPLLARSPYRDGRIADPERVARFEAHADALGEQVARAAGRPPLS